MSEFNKLMAGGSTRPAIQQRAKDKANAWRNWRWTMLISFVLVLIPPHLGILVFIPGLIWGIFVALIEWQG